MSGDQNEPTGPDLSTGIPLAELTESKPFAGVVDGEPAMIVRSGGKLFCVGSKCTHYGGPLDEGLVIDGTVRCPWHHAAFSLETGRMIRTPALHDIPCFDVEERDGKAFVTGRRATPDIPGVAAEDDASVSHDDSHAEHPSSVVIVGAGAAGTVAAVTLRREGYAGRITLLDAGDSTPVDRPNLSKDYLAGNAPEEWIPLFPDSFYTENSIELTLQSRVTSIDTASKSVLLENGSRIEFDALLLTTGAEPIRLDMPNAGQKVHYLRTLNDSRAIIERAKTAKSAVVIGASFIGLEVAASLRTRGLDVTVVAPETVPLERILGAELGQFIKGVHESHGVKFRLGQTVTAVSADGATTSTGDNLPADLIVAGVGVRPNVALAEQAGLATDKGVLVNEYLETSVPGIYAAGDIAKWPDPHTGQNIRVEHWVVAERQGQCAARNIIRAKSGKRERFDQIPFFWSNHYDVAIGYSGNAMKWEAVEISGNLEENDAAVRFRSGDKTLAIATISRDRENLETEAQMEKSVNQLLMNESTITRESGAAP